MASVNDDVLAFLLSVTRAGVDRIVVLRFGQKINPLPSGCYVWTGADQDNGYGRVTIARHTDYAHRASFRLFKGDIPDGFDVCHTCDTRKCVHPYHLYLGTRAINMLDALVKGRTARGDALPHSKLTEADRQTIVARARRGDLYKDIAADMEIHRAHAGSIARQHGVNRNGQR
jgi:hypothetical protein